MYETYPLHVFLGEDWYEQTKTANGKDWFENTGTVYSCRAIQNPAYYYRWLFWSWILSGGSANYGGRWARLQPYFMTDSLVYTEPFSKEKLQFKEQMSGLNGATHIGRFFKDQDIDLSGFYPDHEFVLDLGHRANNGYLKLMRKGNEKFLIYHPNAQTKGIDAKPDAGRTVRFSVNLEGIHKTYSVLWVHPGNGEYAEAGKIEGNRIVEFTAPWPGTDAVLFLNDLNPEP